MKRKKFRPAEWLDKPQRKTQSTPRHGTDTNDIETVTRRIESSHTDITAGYANWRDLGFALSDSLGEAGRDYYHRISRLNHGYNPTECDRQYDRCLRAHGSGITIKTFFQTAKQNGISLSTTKDQHSAHSAQSAHSAHGESAETLQSQPAKNATAESAESAESAEFKERTQDEPLPTFSTDIQEQLPDFLKQIAAISISSQDADILILGAMTVISACLPNISGTYADRAVYPNLFLFITANASSGKGRLTLCRSIVEPIHARLREVNEAEMEEYQQKLTEYNAAGKKKVDLEKPKEPPMRMLFIPANSSATAVYQVLNDNDGAGLMFETEGDTLANTFASDYGNYSDGFRKAFHHEPISYIRRKDREYVDIKHPRLSTLLTGTPRQILNLITDAENGLFSRFAFYILECDIVWKDVFASRADTVLDTRFRQLGEEFRNLHTILSKAAPMTFRLTPEQGEHFNRTFALWQEEYFATFGNGFVASVRRLGVITFRIAMILTALRIMETGEYTNELLCSDTDFRTAMTVSSVLLRHNARVYRNLPDPAAGKQTPETRKTRLQILYDTLPDEFDRQGYVSLATSMGLVARSVERTVQKWCADGRLEHLSYGRYRKTPRHSASFPTFAETE